MGHRHPSRRLDSVRPLHRLHYRLRNALQPDSNFLLLSRATHSILSFLVYRYSLNSPRSYLGVDSSLLEYNCKLPHSNKPPPIPARFNLQPNVLVSSLICCWSEQHAMLQGSSSLYSYPRRPSARAFRSEANTSLQNFHLHPRTTSTNTCQFER